MAPGRRRRVGRPAGADAATHGQAFEDLVARAAWSATPDGEQRTELDDRVRVAAPAAASRLRRTAPSPGRRRAPRCASSPRRRTAGRRRAWRASRPAGRGRRRRARPPRASGRRRSSAPRSRARRRRAATRARRPRTPTIRRPPRAMRRASARAAERSEHRTEHREEQDARRMPPSSYSGSATSSIGSVVTLTHRSPMWLV